MVIVLLIVGLTLLIFAAQWLVKGATGLASRLGISQMIIGLTVVSMGTSMPELIVNVMASVQGNAGLAVGNILGSNIANILLILGATAVLYDLPVKRATILSEVPFSLMAALLIGFLANAALWPEDNADLYLSRGDGIIILFFFMLFMAYVVNTVLLERRTKKAEESLVEGSSKLGINLMWIIIGCIGLFLGGKWVVDSGVELARLAGVSETFIGLTLVALGTSLPELVTSVMAALKKNTDMAVGNVVGSNIFNLLWILGLSAVIHPIPFAVASNIDLLVVVGSSSMILLALIIGRSWVIRRMEGIVFLLAYVLYIWFLVNRG